MPRRVVQISVAAAVSTQNEWFDQLVALCDDGSLWVLDSIGNPQHATWKQLPNVPPSEEVSQ